MSEAYLVESEESNLDLNEKDSRHYGLSRKTCMLKKSLKSIIQKPRFMEILHKQILVMFQESTSLQEDSLARTSQMLERELVSRGVVLHFGNITWKRLGFFDQSTQSLRTFQQSLVEDSMLSLVTLPRSGMMQNGIVFQLPALVHYTVETESSSFPTPTVADTFTDNLKSSQQKEGSRHSVNLSQAVQMWRTPTSRIGGGANPSRIDNDGREVSSFRSFETDKFGDASKYDANTESWNVSEFELRQRKTEVESRETSDRFGYEDSTRRGWWAVEPCVGRVADGIPSRVDRIKCLGNAVVPQFAQVIARTIKEYEKERGKS